MLKLENIEELTMRYIFKDGTQCYNCIQDNEVLTLSPDKQTIRFTLKPKLSTVNIAPFDIAITIKDNRYWVKSDFFEDVSTLYPLNLFIGDEETILMVEFSTEIMYLHAEHI